MAVRFGVIFITDDKTKELRSILECKKECNFIWFIESRAIIHNTPKIFEGESLSDLLGIRISEVAFVVSTNESDTIFNLKNYLLVLAKNFNSKRYLVL
ncbi:hypothetical protein JP0160_11140 [Helicobacter pylori]